MCCLALQVAQFDFKGMQPACCRSNFNEDDSTLRKMNITRNKSILLAYSKGKQFGWLIQRQIYIVFFPLIMALGDYCSCFN